MTTPCTQRGVIATYVVVSLLFALALSIIWAINTLFLLDAGLSIFQVMLVNTAFLVGQILFEIPTGVLADAIGRRTSLLLSFLTLTVSTTLYVLSADLGWGIPGFVAASLLVGLGFSLHSGILSAWLVDALDACGWEGPKDRAFARGEQAFNVGVLGGSLIGGVLGQFDLSWPYYARASLLVVALVVTAIMLRDQGFTPTPLRASTFTAETRRIFIDGVSYGWSNRVIRPLLFVSLVTSVFVWFGFFSWQRYMLDLVGREYVWLSGVVQAGSSVMAIIGNASVGRIMGRDGSRREAATVLAALVYVEAVLVLGIGLVGVSGFEPGWLPWAIATAGWLAWGFAYGVELPVRQSYINRHIPSERRATVLSLDAFFLDIGGTAGQPALGFIAQRASIPVGWLVGSVFLGAAAPLYLRSRSAAREVDPPARPNQ